MFKKVLVGFLFAVAMPILASAHSVTLSFTKSTDDIGAAGSGYTTWRMTGSCPASVTTTAGFTALNATVFTTNSYVDAGIAPGAYCYIVTFKTSSATSVPSNTSAAAILPVPPTTVTVTDSN